MTFSKETKIPKRLKGYDIAATTNNREIEEPLEL